MAKKDLSKAAGLDALFRRPTLPVEENTPPVKQDPPPKPKARKEEPRSSTVSPPKPQKQPAKKKAAPRQEALPKEQAASPNIFSVNLEGIRKMETKYTGIRLKKDLFDRLGEIARKEKVKSTNSLIAKVLEAFCDGYEGKT